MLGELNCRGRVPAVLGLLALAGCLVAWPSASSAQAPDALEAGRLAFAAGKLDDAERLAGALDADRPDVAMLLAEVAEARGQLDRAQTLYARSIAGGGGVEAALRLGLLLQALGRADQAAPLLQPLLDAAASMKAPDDVARAARAARALGQHRLANSLYRDAAAARPDSASINTGWGDLLLEKHNVPEAVRSYQLALKADPEFAPAHLGLAKALAEENPPAAIAAATRARTITPILWDAWLVEADLALARKDHPETQKLLAVVLAGNPSSLGAHALTAALAWVEDRRSDFEAALARALAINPSWGEAYRVVAEHAAGRYRFEAAATLARQATVLDAGNALAWADLGKHLLRTGDEAAARVALERAFELDPFNQITFNLLGLLDTLKDFTVIDADGLVVKLHPDEAPIMRDRVTSLASRALTDLGARYGFTPRGPVLVEMFPRHDDFAVRNVGLPGMVGALGACFGRVVTLDSPKARQPPGSFNWAATLWHELAHVITLQLSDQRVSRWVTEGASVFEERRASPSWGRESELEFVQALVDGTTMPLATLNAGFSDPRRITLAYHQASLVVEHLVEQFGDAGLVRLLRAYGEGLDDEAALKKATGIAMADLQRSFDAFVEARFGAQRRALMPVEGLEEVGADPVALKAFAAKHPDSFLTQMALGSVLLREQEFAGARQAFERAAALVPAATGPKGPRAMLAEVAEAAGEPALRRAALLEAIDEHHTALDLARELQQAAREAGDDAALGRAAARVIEVDPFDAAAHSDVGRLALANGHLEAARQSFQLALLAGPGDLVAAHTDLAEALLAAGKDDEAKQQAVAALEMAPRFARAQDVLLAVVERPRR
jgi:tetratricopeptide (TPR) repeat protein